MSRDSYLVVSLHPPRCYVLTQRIHHGVSGLAVGAVLGLCLHGRLRYAALPLIVWGLTDYKDARLWLRRERFQRA